MSISSLQHMIMHKLCENSLSGYSLVKEIERSTGQKPSFGSIYPILERLKNDGLLSMKVDGRKKIYTITAKGRAFADEIRTSKGHLIEDMTKNCRTMFELIGQDPRPMLAMLESMKRGEDPLAPVKKNMFMVRDLVFLMAQDGRLKKNHKAINTILVKTYHDLEKLT